MLSSGEHAEEGAGDAAVFPVLFKHVGAEKTKKQLKYDPVTKFSPKSTEEQNLQLTRA